MSLLKAKNNKQKEILYYLHVYLINVKNTWHKIGRNKTKMNFNFRFKSQAYKLSFKLFEH